MTTPYRFLIALLVALAWAAPPAAAQDAPPYAEGSVWDVSYVRTEPGQFDAYMENLRGNWARGLDLAIERGYVLSYRVISGEPANRDDWDIMLLVEYPNMAALDNAQEKSAEIARVMSQTRQQSSEMTAQRVQLRELLGGKLARELTFRP